MTATSSGVQPGKLPDPSVVLDRVSLTFRTPVSEPPAGASGLSRTLHRVTFTGYRQEVQAVDNVTLVARNGDSIGLIGSNGAGKSTLLRIIAGAQTPTRGSVLARSQPRLQAVGAALVPTLSGNQNARLGALATGLKRAEVERILPKIVEMAGLGEAMARPMKTYSSGMRARLIFSINAFTNADIMLIDEALATGDAAFASRAREAMTELRSRAGTVFMVSHTRRSIETMCTRAIWMHKGRVNADGPTKELMELYAKWSKESSEGKVVAAQKTLLEASALHPPVQTIEYESPRSSRHQRPLHAA